MLIVCFRENENDDAKMIIHVPVVKKAVNLTFFFFFFFNKVAWKLHAHKKQTDRYLLFL